MRSLSQLSFVVVEIVQLSRIAHKVLGFLTSRRQAVMVARVGIPSISDIGGVRTLGRITSKTTKAHNLRLCVDFIDDFIDE